MDQFKVILGHVQKYHFWILCLVCAVLGLVAWNMAARSLSQDFESRKSAISGKFNSLQTILSEPDFPNSDWEAEVKELTDEQKKRVRAAWEEVYRQQAGVLNWPDALGDQFKRYIATLKQGDDIHPTYRERYMTVIPQEINKLRAIVGVEAPDSAASTASTTSTSSTTAPAVGMSHVRMVWDSGNQGKIEEKLRFSGTPTAPQVWLTQEDLWVYTVLLNAIKNVNAGKYVPPIKGIDQLLIAQEAAKEFERGMRPDIIAKPAVAAASGGGYDGGAAGGGGMGVEAAGSPAPDEGRYLSAEGRPMPAGSPAGPFKRMPVYLKLMMDQREIPTLLAECANAPMPVEVRQLRIAPSSASSASGGSSSRSTTAATAPASVAVGSHDVPVEIAGIIYIYNPPDTARLGGSQTGDDATGVPGG